MMIERRDRGAVHILVVIIVLVVALIGWGIGIKQLSENEAALNAQKQAQEQKVELEEKLFRATQAYNDLSGLVIGNDSAPMPAIDATETPEAWREKIDKAHRPYKQALSDAWNLFEGNESEVTGLIKVATPAEAKINKLEGEITSLKSSIEQLKTEKSAASNANVALVAQHGGELQTKNDELASTRTRLNAQLQQAQENHEGTSTQLAEMSGKYEAETVKRREEVTVIRDATEKLESEVAILKAPEKIKRKTQRPDGKVISANLRTGMAWVDVGSRKFVRRGTRFKAYGLEKGGQRVDHGYLVVTDVQRDKSLCRLEDGAQVRAGDLIFNPHFDGESQKVFYFLGEMQGVFDNQEARAILEANGAKVSEKLTIHVDFLVLGANPDPEAAVGEDADPNWFKDTQEYNDAVRWGIEMIRSRDLATYLQY